jgi:hypothetical protein
MKLISPAYDFGEFCQSLLGKDPMQVLDAASAEITYARQNHREQTKDSNFRKGSKGRIYCENLQQFIALFMGTVPDEISQDFLAAVRPLALNLLQKWEIASMRELVSRQIEAPSGVELGELADFLAIVVSKDEVDTGDISRPLGMLEKLLQSPKTARVFEERVDLAFHGYNDVTFELFEIPQVRSFVLKLDEKFPYWLFFLSKHHLGLQCILLCFLPPSLTEAGRARVFPERIGDLLTRRWLPAMNHVCSLVDYSEQDVHRLTERALAYIKNGRFPSGE